MRKERAQFGCEHSAHCYYKDNWYADSGIITSLIVLELYSKAKKEGRKFSDLLSEFRKRDKIEEKSFTVLDKEKLLKKIEAKYRKRAIRVRKIDGLTMEFTDWWFNLRASNTEPVLRVNLEAENRKLMLEKEAELIKLIRN
jgi:phosphomannomutase